ncbi:MAG: S8 family serine peptidase, partial [Dehalococcoidia bacterium]|nr:S8 family serine peptidase [Dehalococcoidia bacterium]
NNGNTPGKGNSVLYPARFDSVIAVGATDPADSRPRFSSTGPAVELAAPGVNVLSTFLGGAYVPMSGTSMASPHVVGTAALIIASLTVTDTDDENGIANEVRDRLNTTADDLGTPGRDVQYGFGLVDADEAAAPVE